MPKSYVETEPAAQRALHNAFDPYKQVQSRLQALVNNGHPVDKIEMIIKGGTWSAYSREYQVWFVTRSFEACNDFPATNLSVVIPDSDRGPAYRQAGPVPLVFCIHVNKRKWIPGQARDDKVKPWYTTDPTPRAWNQREEAPPGDHL